jgi:hypothetical protein
LFPALLGEWHWMSIFIRMQVGSAVKAGFWTTVDMASGRYLWRTLVAPAKSESDKARWQQNFCCVFDIWVIGGKRSGNSVGMMCDMAAIVNMISWTKCANWHVWALCCISWLFCLILAFLSFDYCGHCWKYEFWTKFAFYLFAFERFNIMTTELGIWQFPEIISDVSMHGRKFQGLLLSCLQLMLIFQCWDFRS